MSGLPISLNCENVSALVVGGGGVGTRKALALHEAGARVRVIALDLSPDMTAAASANDKLSIEKRSYAGQRDIGDANIVIAATDSREVNETIATDARALHRLVNVVDDPESGSFVSMAVHRAGAVTIGVGTGSVPSAAVRIRDALAERFDARYAEAVAGAAALRSEVLASKGADAWAKIHQRVIAADFCERVENATFAGELSACR